MDGQEPVFLPYGELVDLPWRPSEFLRIDDIANLVPGNFPLVMRKPREVVL